MIDITLPAAVVEAAARALAKRKDGDENAYIYLIGEATAALLAGLKAWPGVVTKGEVEVNANGGLNGYYLPLPTENSND